MKPLTSPLREEAQRLLASAGKVSRSLPSVTVILPHRLRRKLRSTRSKLASRTSPAAPGLTSLQTSLHPADTLRALRLHQWSFYDGQYLLMVIFAVFSLAVMQHPGPMTKTLIAALLLTALVIPITRQFFLPVLPIFTWLVFFDSCQ